jgi:hypothetical protein
LAFAVLAAVSKEGGFAIAERLTLKLGNPEGVGNALANLASLIVSADPKALVTALFGTNPDGFDSLLKRVGNTAFPNQGELYASLWGVYDRHEEVTAILAQVPGQISLATIETILSLDPIALNPLIVEHVGGPKIAKRLSSCIRTIRKCCPDVSDLEIKQSLSAIGSTFALDHWIMRFLTRRLTQLPYNPAVAVDDPDFRPLTTGPDFLLEGRRFRNCLKTKIGLAVAGKAGYFVTRGPEDIVVEVRRLTSCPHWIVTDVKGYANRALNDQEWQWVMPKLKARNLSLLSAIDGDGEDLLTALGYFDFPVFEAEAPAVIDHELTN